MNDLDTAPETDEAEPGLFKKYPRLSIILIAIVAYSLLLAMCAVVAVLMLRG